MKSERRALESLGPNAKGLEEAGLSSFLSVLVSVLIIAKRAMGGRTLDL